MLQLSVVVDPCSHSLGRSKTTIYERRSGAKAAKALDGGCINHF